MRQLQLIVLLFFVYCSTSYAEEIRIGMTTALSGPLKEIGEEMRNGIEAYFININHHGGIQGKQLRLISKDDGYVPERAAENMRYLIENENIVAIIGNVGTPTAIVTAPIANEKKTLLFGALTGAELLRQKENNRYVINYRASYADEAETMISGLLSIGIKPEEIAFFTQRDSYGNAGYNGAAQSLKKHGYTDTTSLAHGRYTRNTLNVEGAVATILDAEIEPKAIIMAGSYKPSAKFIKLVQKTFPDMLFLNYSFVGSFALKQALGDNADGIIITEVVPSINSYLPAVNEYREDFWTFKNSESRGFVSFEGYIVARIFVEALKRIEGNINSEKIIDSLNNIDSIDVGIGLDISYNVNKKQAIHNVWPMIIKNNRFKPLNWNKLNRFSSLIDSIPVISKQN